MYTDYYKLQDMPFRLSPDPKFFYASSAHNRAIAHLRFGLNQGEGFIVITGEVGAGKTTLASYILGTVDQNTYVTATVVTTQLQADDMLRMVASAFGLSQEGADKATLLRRVEGFVADSYKAGRRCLLIIDEAQNLPLSALEELRMLSNLQIGGACPLQSLLLAQPQFRTILGQDDLAQLRQRVIASYHLGPMAREETKGYVQHRLHLAGWRHDPEITADAFEAIYQHTEGVPRRINLLCSRLLLYGFLEETHSLDRPAVDAVAYDLQADLAEVSKGGNAAGGGETASDTGNGLMVQRQIDSLTGRLDQLEQKMEKHGRIFNRLLQAISNYLDDQNGVR